MKKEDVLAYNKKAWNHAVESGDVWTKIIGEDRVAEARKGEPYIILSPSKPVPRSWLQPLEGKKVLGLAAGGGQQSALLAAAGADVTIADLSNKQLEQDQAAAEKYGLKVQTVCTPADNLSAFADESFDLIVNPLSNCFFPDLKPVWQECHRVLKKSGRIMFACMNPVSYLFDFEKANRGEFELKYSQPFSDVESFSEEEKKRFLRPENPVEHGHSLETQFGELMRTGFVMIDLYEDHWGPDFGQPIDKYFPVYINVLAEKR